MLSINKTIKRILRDHNLIDNGVSDIISQCVEVMSAEVIQQQLSVTELSARFVAAMMSNPAYDHDVFTYDELSRIGIAQAINLIDNLEGRLNEATEAKSLDS